MATGNNNPRNIILLAALALVLALAIGRALLAGRSSAAPSPPASPNGAAAPAAGTPGPAAQPGSAPVPGSATAPGAPAAPGAAADDATTVDMASLPKLLPAELRDPYQPPVGFGVLHPKVIQAAPTKPVVKPIVVPPAPHSPLGPGPLPIGLTAPAALHTGPGPNLASGKTVGAAHAVAPESPEQELQRRVVLKGVLIGPYPSAFITIDGNQQLAHKGDRLPRGYRISQITEDEIVAVLGGDMPGRGPVSTVDIRQ
ncbi:MAG TPA: hypothetical protein VFJ58_20150 [Armatimonadota bacterium]|nr:hypothetical protein [Armatimonadota bacterium]